MAKLSKLGLSVALFSLSAGSAYAQLVPDNVKDLKQPAEIAADSIKHLKEESAIEAAGDVEISYEGTVMKSDYAHYSQKSRQVSAKGNIRIDEAMGDVYLADEAYIKDDFSEGTIKGASGKLQQRALFSAETATREQEDITILEDVAFTLCKACEDGEPKNPLWMFNAGKVEYNQLEERVYYEDASLKVLGVPVAYTPYFSHPTPNAQRKSGFLYPSYGSTDELGFIVKTPYYYNIAPHMDAVVTPIITTDEGPVLSGNFRHLTSHGKYEISGSITNPQERDEFGLPEEGRKIRGHIEAQGLFDLNYNNWQLGFDAKRASDDTYLRRYQFGNEDLLTSTAYLEQLSNRNFINIRTLAFQGLNIEDDPDTTPFIAPLVESHHEGETGFNEIGWSFDTNSYILERDDGVSAQRFSAEAGLNRSFITQGHVFTAATSLRTDFWNTQDAASAGPGLNNASDVRVVPDVSLRWEYPLAAYTSDYSMRLEPIVDLIYSPNGNNPSEISNEDSQEIELNDINLFSKNRFSGYDLIESGFRSNYGVKGGINYYGLGSLDFLLGQAYHEHEEDIYPELSGLTGNFSDVVGRVSISDNQYSRLSYHFRMDKDNGSIDRSEVVGNVNVKGYSGTLRYIRLDEDENVLFNQEEIVGGINIPVHDNWRISANGRRDITDDAAITASLGATFVNECLSFSTILYRDYTSDRDIKPSTSVLFKVTIANL